MEQSGPTPAAQYLRKSSEHQKYSLENQAAALAMYAMQRDYAIVRTYTDAGRSGLTFKGRPGLKALIADVLAPHPPFAAILVFDVSRWGRYQDPDQAAHYEFICRDAGVDVRYCGEMFENDGSLSSSIMKQLKRVMAAEYSRELGVRVLRGQRRIVSMGFSAGGPAPFGFRRELVAGDGRARMLLESGQVKAIATDRVRLVPGPRTERETVRNIFRMYVRERTSVKSIVRALIRSGAPSPAGGWSAYKVRAILDSEVYTGWRIYGRTTEALRSKRRRVPESEWVKARIGGAVVSVSDSTAARALLAARYRRRSDEELISALRDTLARTGRLSSALLDSTPELPNKSTVQARFGSLTRAFELAGQPPRKGVRKWTREALLAELQRVHKECGAADENALRRDSSAPLPRTFARWFGTLQGAQLAAGLPVTAARVPLSKPRRSRTRLILELRRIHREQGRLGWAEIEADGHVSARTIRRRFGSLDQVRAAAGLDQSD